MNIYFSCSITGGRQDQEVYTAVVDAMLKDGHVVPTAHLSSPDVLVLEADLDPRDVYLRDVAWVEGCDAMVAEVSTPSHGVGYEIALAVSIGKPVLCCYREGKKVSRMIIGNANPTLKTAAYRTTAEAVDIVRLFLNRIS